jgi:hypothetical protein
MLKCKGKAIPLQALTGPEGSRKLRLPDFQTIGTRGWQGCQPYAPYRVLLGWSSGILVMRHVIMWMEVSHSCSHTLSLSLSLSIYLYLSQNYQQQFETLSIHPTSFRCFEQLVVEIMHINVLLNFTIID